VSVRVSSDCLRAIRRAGVRPTRFLLSASVAAQKVSLFELQPLNESRCYQFARRFLASTSRFGVGQKQNSNQTPLGLHRIAKKVGGGEPIGTVFKSRKPIGLTWNGLPEGGIVHRILWLEGLESGFNQGDGCDTFDRYIYIHGFADEMTLGRPRSQGCIHLAASDLIPLYDVLPPGTLVWIDHR